MKRILIVIAAGLIASSACALEGVLMVADEIPAMQVLAAQLQREEGLVSTIVTQTNLPPQLAPYAAVMVYIHKDLAAPTEQALIQYANGGGKLIVLHHSISSGKRKNKDWFRFLGLTLPEGGVAEDGYQWIEGVSLELVNLAPDQFVTTNKVRYESQVSYTSSATAGREKQLPGWKLSDTEVYLNHVLTDPKTILFGFKYIDPNSKRVFMQDRAGWFKKAGSGWVFYFMAGHSARDFENNAYARILANAVIFKPPVP